MYTWWYTTKGCAPHIIATHSMRLPCLGNYRWTNGPRYGTKYFEMALIWILTCNVKDLAKANMKLSLHNVSICKAFISSKAMPSMFVTWCVISIYLNTTRSDGTCGTRWWCNDNTCSQRNLSRIVVDSDKIPPLEVESLPRGVDRTRVEAMIQHTRTS